MLNASASWFHLTRLRFSAFVGGLGDNTVKTVRIINNTLVAHAGGAINIGPVDANGNTLSDVQVTNTILWNSRTDMLGAASCTWTAAP